jgi:hypothetical protein
VDRDRLRSRLRHYAASARLRGYAAPARQAHRLGHQERLDGAKEGDADERHDFRFVAANLAIEDSPALHVLGGHQIVDPWTRARDQVRDPEPEFGQPRIVTIGNRLGHQARFRQQLPEAIREPGEMMAGLRGTHAGIDADEEHAHAGLDAVGQPKVGPIHSEILDRQCTMHA